MSELLQRWENFQPTKVQIFWVCVAAVAAILFGGFGLGGWTTAGKAQQMASDAGETARRDLAIAVCVEEFMHTADAGARMKKLQGASFYERGDLIAAGGFATMPDRKEPDSAVAAQCALALEQAKAPPANAKR